MKKKVLSRENLFTYRILFILVASLWIFSADLLILNTLNAEPTMPFSLHQQNALTGNFNKLVGSDLSYPSSRDLLFFNGLLLVCFTLGYASWEKRKTRSAKKGQAAMEFLMTYGWAILVAIITIGALAYFGVLNPKFGPDTCIFSTPGFACKDSAVSFVGAGQAGPLSTDHNVLHLQLINSFGKDMTNVALTILVASVACTTYADESGTPAPTTLADGLSQSFYVDCSTVTTAVPIKGKFTAVLRVNYILKGQSLIHTLEGEIRAKVEK